MNSAQKSGFTLIELLVVISIIAILSTVGLIAYGSAKKSSRIGKRIQDLQAIQAALTSYYTANGSYPSSNGGWRSECSSWGGYSQDQVIPGLVPTYMNTFPSDPAMNKASSTSCYLYNSNGTDYKVLDHNVIELSPSDYLSQSTLVDPGRDGGPNACLVDGQSPWAWAIYSSSVSACW